MSKMIEDDPYGWNKEGYDPYGWGKEEDLTDKLTPNDVDLFTHIFEPFDCDGDYQKRNSRFAEGMVTGIAGSLLWTYLWYNPIILGMYSKLKDKKPKSKIVDAFGMSIGFAKLPRRIELAMFDAYRNKISFWIGAYLGCVTGIGFQVGLGGAILIDIIY